jgi:hypothetical protein
MRNYKSTVTARTLSAAVTSTTAASIFLTDTAALPTYPFTLVLDPDTTSEEIVTVTGAGGGAGELVVTRAQDGTTGKTHAVVTGAVRHMITARDLQEPQNHIDATGDVHGLATAGPGSTTGGSVVGTSASQTLTNKTLSSSSISFSGSSATINFGTRTDAFVANGTSVSASQLANITSIANKITDPGAWTSYTPTISGGTGTVWALGANGVISAKWTQIGKTVHFKGSFKIGSATVVGDASLTLSLPTASAAADANSVYAMTGTGRCTLTGLAATGTIIASQTSDTTFQPQVVISAATAGNATTRAGISSGNYTKNANDTIIFTGTYEAA